MSTGVQFAADGQRRTETSLADLRHSPWQLGRVISFLFRMDVLVEPLQRQRVRAR
jgi:hypothetical protein